MQLEKQFRSFIADVVKYSFESEHIDYLWLTVPFMSKTFISASGKKSVVEFIKKVKSKVDEERQDYREGDDKVIDEVIQKILKKGTTTT